MTRREAGWAAWTAGAALALAAVTAADEPPRLGVDASRAFEMARAAEDGAVLARDEGEGAWKKIQAIEAGGALSEPVKQLRDEAGTAFEALEGYRRLAQAAASETYKLLAEVTRAAAPTPPDIPRQEVFEQRALLAAHEAAVMGARARAEAERLRAIHADVRALLAAGAPEKAPAAAATPREAEAGDGRVAVPNLVGARLVDAARDLTAAGLTLGRTTGPHDGYVIKQEPAPGSRVLTQTAVRVTLSGSAAGVRILVPR